MIVGIISEKKKLIVKYLIYENIMYDIIKELNVFWKCWNVINNINKKFESKREKNF